MTRRILASLPLLLTAAAARADVGGAFDGAAISGLMLIGTAAAVALGYGWHEWRRESGRPAPVQLRVKARRYRQP